MSDAPHLGGFTAIALFVAVLVAAVVQTAFTQVCSIVACFWHNTDEVDQVCTSLARVPTTRLALVSSIHLALLLHTPPLPYVTHPRLFSSLLAAPPNKFEVDANHLLTASLLKDI
jgi:hypothetical protein